MKRRQKEGFLSPKSSKITVTKEKESRKTKSEEKERRRREKSNGCTLSFHNSYFEEFARCKYACICECMHVRMYKETDGTGLTLEHMYVCQQGPQS